MIYSVLRNRLNIGQKKREELMEKLDEFLNIHTTGVHEPDDPTLFDYNRTESTEYRVLDRLFKHYRVQSHDKLVDFGAGKGRVLFYVHYYQNIPVTGIEMNQLAFADLKQNKANYFKEHADNKNELTIIQGLVEDYEIKQEDTIFYFFNPFSINIFKQVMKSIRQSLRKHPRQADIIFYYPPKNIKNYILNETSFKEFKKIETRQHQIFHEYISVFRSQPIIN